MQIDTTTFILQLVNFLVLVWILHRFLYRPVMAAIDRRRAAIDQSIADARREREEADRLRKQAEARVADWERERTRARTALEAELAVLRKKGLAEVAQAEAQARERHAALQAKREAGWKRETEQLALDQAAAFAARLLARVADAALDERLVDVLAEDLRSWPEARISPLAEAARASGGRVRVTSARPLAEAARGRLARALSERLGVECHPEYAADEALLGGVRVALGPWVLQASLRDELRALAGAEAHGG
jgi:F-type H+-transporting ATPase subunit b